MKLGGAALTPRNVHIDRLKAYSSDVRLVRGEKAIFPMNWLFERSTIRRDVKFPKHEGGNSSILFSDRYSSWRSFNSHQAVENEN